MHRTYRDPDGTTWIETRLIHGTSRLQEAEQRYGAWLPRAGGRETELPTDTLADTGRWTRITTDDRITHLASLLGPVLAALPDDQADPIRDALAALYDIPDEARASRRRAHRAPR